MKRKLTLKVLKAFIPSLSIVFLHYPVRANLAKPGDMIPSVAEAQHAMANCDTVIRIPTMPRLCWDDDPVDLVKVSGINPANGYWVSYDTIGAGWTRITNDSLNGALKNNVLDPRLTSAGGGKYYLRYYYEEPGCKIWRDTLITINPLPKPQISKFEFMRHSSFPPYAFCNEDTAVYMSANPSGGTFNSDMIGAVKGIRFIPANVQAKVPFWIRYYYTDPVTTCADLDSVNVVVYDAPEINILNSDTAFCLYEDVTLHIKAKVTNSDMNYSGLIFNGKAGDPVLVNGSERDITIPFYNSDSTRIWKVVGYANDLMDVCPPAQDVLNITTYMFPQPEILRAGDSLFCNLNNVSHSYQWFLDGTSIAGATGRSLKMKSTGSYSVRVTNKSGCESMSDVFKVVALGTDLFQNGEIEVWPNPAGDIVTVHCPSGNISPKTVMFVDMYGRTVSRHSIGEGVEFLELDISHFEGGVYQFYMVADEAVYSTKIIVR